MARYLLTDPAKADVRNIISYIRQDSPDAAKRVRAKLREAMQLLSEMPEIGHHREDVADDSLKFWNVYSYLIVYLPKAKPLTIIRVLHGARDVPRSLR